MRVDVIDVAALAADPDAPVVVSMMMLLNDLERIAYLRNIHTQAALPQGVLDAGQFAFSVGGYTANLALAHVFEASLILRTIGQNDPMFDVIQADQALQQAYNNARAFVDDTVDPATGLSPYQRLLQRWRNLRNSIIFHYNPHQNVIANGLALVAQHYQTSTSFTGEAPDEATFHELAFEVTDAIASTMFQYPFPPVNNEAAEALAAETQALVSAMRIFAARLVQRYIEMYTAQNQNPPQV